MNVAWLLFSAILWPAICGLVTLLIPRMRVNLRVAAACLGPLISTAILACFVHVHGARTVVSPIEWVPTIHLELGFLTGPLSLFFAFLIAIFGLLIVLYSRAYFGPDAAALRRFYPCLLLFMTAMLGVVLSDSLVLLLIFWELTSVSSFLLIGWDRTDAHSRRQATQAFIVTGAGGLALMAGFILLGLDTQAWSITQLSNTELLHEIAGHPRTYIGLLLIFIGAAAKSAQMPFHFWLPGAMAAPTPVSAYLHSATMVKAGVYLVGVLTYAGGNQTVWPLVLIPIGLATMLYGAVIALQKTDLKQIFAYCTVSQLGLLMASFGMPWAHAAPRVEYDVFQIFNHALYKAPLFILAGAIGHLALTRELPELNGLARGSRMQRTLAWLLLAAGYALAAGPFTFGFLAKEYLLTEVWAAAQNQPWFYAAITAIVLASALNVAIFIRMVIALVLKPVATEHHDRAPHDLDSIDTHIEQSAWRHFLWLPAAILLAIQFAGGLFPSTLRAMLAPIMGNPGMLEIPSLLSVISHASAPLLCSVIGFGLGGAIAFSPLFRGTATDPYDRLFPWCHRAVVRGGGWVFSRMQNGDLGFYIAAVFATAVALFAWAIRGDGAYFHWPAHLLNEPASNLFIACGLVLFACVPALFMTIVHSRITRVLLLGATGFGVTCIYFAWHAPDLALTQIAIEVVSIILFLLVLAKLPDQKIKTPHWILLPRVLISLAVGLIMFWLTLSSSVGDRPAMLQTRAEGGAFHDLGEYFLRNTREGVDSTFATPAQAGPATVDRGTPHAQSFGTHPPEQGPGNIVLHKGGGGDNAVNVILVDFRGFDTMGEITVLGLAAMGVWMLLRKRSKTTTLAPAPLTSIILKSASRLIVPFSLTLAIFIYFKGHQTPGGGFVAGLVTAVGLVIHRMAEGAGSAVSLRKIMPCSERALIATGLLFALATGASALAFNLPFFTSNNGVLPLPWSEHGFHWATVMMFDLGVFLVVTGVVVGMINVLFDDHVKGGAA